MLNALPRCFRLLAAAGLGFGTSSASSCDEVSSLQTLLESGSQSCDVLHPKKGLSWSHTKKIGQVTVYVGNLTVPLSPHEEDVHDTPFIDLMVMMTIHNSVEDASTLEPLLIHCGGPGSDASCVLHQGKEPQYSGYASWSISQRGIGFAASPSFECEAKHMKLPEKNRKNYRISDFTDCPCALPDGTALVGQSFVAIDPLNGSEVENHLSKMTLRSRRCAASPKWILTGPRNKSFNFLEFSGTRMLAHDIEFFRTRVCAHKMHLNGASYGTAVAATYGNMFHQRVGKMAVNGNMPPNPFTLDFAEGQGMALTMTFAHLEMLCIQWTATPPCNWFQDQKTLNHVWESLLDELRKGRLTAPTEILGSNGAKVTFPLSIGLLQGYLQEQMISAGFVPTGWAQPVLTIANLAGFRGAEAKTQQVKAILDRYCVLPSSPGKEAWSGVKTWSLYGTCVGQQSVGLSSSYHSKHLEGLGIAPFSKGVDGFINEATVLGQDLFGRFTVNQAMDIWTGYRQKWDEMAISAFLGIFSSFFAWQLDAVPVQVGYRAGLKALVVGNLYDPACSFTWSNHMRESLPDSVMIVWQGVGHCLSQGGDYPGSGMKPCLDLLARYWRTGELPVDGFTCRVEKPVPLGNWNVETQQTI